MTRRWITSSVSTTSPIARQPRYRDAVVQQMVTAIVNGDIPAEARLPTEADLVSQFGVSRTVTREALKMLEAKGLVDVQHGRGAIVLERERWNQLDSDILAAEMSGPKAERLFDEVMELRLALECQMAASAAERITENQLQVLRELLGEMQNQIQSPDTYLDMDILFHELILEAAGNHIVRAIMVSIAEPLRQNRKLTNLIPGGLQKAHAFHESILRRLEAHDPTGTRELMRKHLVWAWERWRSTGWGVLQDASSDGNSTTTTIDLI